MLRELIFPIFCFIFLYGKVLSLHVFKNVKESKKVQEPLLYSSGSNIFLPLKPLGKK